MECGFHLLLVLEATALAYSASIPMGDQNYKTIRNAIDIYNVDPNVSSLFRLLSYDFQNKEVETSDETKLKFKIKETLCDKNSQKATEECNFKENGEVRNCTTIAQGPDMKNIVINCDRMIDTNNLINDNTEEQEKEKEKHKSSNNVRQVNKSNTSKLRRKRNIATHFAEFKLKGSCLQCVVDMINPWNQ
ncbi:cathelicidin-2-like [Discoglossus pictus]